MALAWAVLGLVSFDTYCVPPITKVMFHLNLMITTVIYAGDNNNCWDYCFSKEEQIATSLVTIVKNQKLDGVDIDYEYCYDISNTQAGRCSQRTTAYTDGKAQNFLNVLTSKLRNKLDALQLTNGYSRGRYIVTHAPMDSDLTPSTSTYFQILKARRSDLDFLMPQVCTGCICCLLLIQDIIFSSSRCPSFTMA